MPVEQMLFLQKRTEEDVHDAFDRVMALLDNPPAPLRRAIAQAQMTPLETYQQFVAPDYASLCEEALTHHEQSERGR